MERSIENHRRVFATLDGLVLQYIAGVDTEELRPALHDLWEYIEVAARRGVEA